MDIQSILSANIRRWRKKAGMSQERLADLCETSPIYIRQIEAGIRTPSIKYVGKIAGALRVLPHQLFYADIQSPDYPPDERSELRKAEEQAVIERIAAEIHTMLDKLSV